MAAACEVFNVGSGTRTDVATVARRLMAAYNVNVPMRVSGTFRAGDIRDCYADLTRATSVLGFTPAVDFDKGIGRFAEWVNRQEVMRDDYDQSIQEMKNKGLYR